MSNELKELNDALEQAFAKATELYSQRGFQRRLGFGRKPALINVDLANAWTRPGNPFTCDNIDEQIIPGVQKLLAACRANNIPVVHTTTNYQVTDRNNPNTDMGLWHEKIPIEIVDQKNEELWAIDSRIAPIDGEQVVVKKRASGFHGTYLAGFLRAAGVDTILVTGVTASACVRETVCDGLAE
ncbi:MAG: isochorismatase family protein, partial [Gammaproteobacteria bacterium]|nr:isochorismatase family protein [Gammaproteobacteria bacterium]